MPFKQFDRSRLHLRPLTERQHDITQAVMIDPDAPATFEHPSIDILTDRIRKAKERSATVLWMMGAHVISYVKRPVLDPVHERRFRDALRPERAGASYEEAVSLGNLASSVTIRKIGQTGTSTPEEILDAFELHNRQLVRTSGRS